jgi:hypothetical protein
MATLNVTDGLLQDSLTLTKKTGTTITLSTNGTYVDKNIKFTLGVRDISGSIGGSASAGKATAVIANTNSMENTTNTEPSGTAGSDYWEVKATATGTAGEYTPKYTVNTSGWLESTVTGSAKTVSVTSDSTGKSLYIGKAVGIVDMVPGNGSCDYDSSSSENVTTSDTNTSGVKVVFTGSGSVSAVAKITTAGYTSVNNSFATSNSTSSNSVPATKYITGITLTNGK